VCSTQPDYPIARHIIPSFVFHETIPGHHLQGALARELDLPAFSRVLDFNGYTEGWAVYAERLAWEMGLYETDPLETWAVCSSSCRAPHAWW